MEKTPEGDYCLISCDVPNQEHNEAKQEHENGNLVDSMHHPQIQVALILFEEVDGIKVIQNFL